MTNQEIIDTLFNNWCKKQKITMDDSNVMKIAKISFIAGLAAGFHTSKEIVFTKYSLEALDLIRKLDSDTTDYHNSYGEHLFQ